MSYLVVCWQTERHTCNEICDHAETVFAYGIHQSLYQYYSPLDVKIKLLHALVFL